jgi:hypothetical protein
MEADLVCSPTALSFIKYVKSTINIIMLIIIPLANSNKFSPLGREIEPLIDVLINPIAAYWINDSTLFKQLHDISQGCSTKSISHRATAFYLWMQLELVNTVFIPINETIIRCINYSHDINSAAVNSDAVKQIKGRSALEFLTSTFQTKKALYWLKAQLKLNKLLLDPGSDYYQLVDAAMKSQIQQLTAPWLHVLDVIKSRSAANCKCPMSPVPC